ncbi:MAG TPA: ionic transporter y4hA [Burkholderiaceae bacterium]|jgi:Ca2+:H+ antiporter|nr:ionic transporter y4hA [Burkholderiaceae bacterium]
MPLWTIYVPIASAALLVATLVFPGVGLLVAICVPALLATVFAAVHHAEVVAHRVGEPFGTLVLALAVTIIEVALIVSMMLTGGPDAPTLARDTIYSAVMIICGGVVGVCLVLGGWRHHEQTFHVGGANAALAALITLATLSLILPGFTTSTPGPSYTGSQLAFAAIASLVVWGVFVAGQTMRYQAYFLPEENDAHDALHAERPSVRVAWASFGLLFVSLVTVVGLAKALSPSIEAAVHGAGAPNAVIGIAIALLVLLPETVSAVRAARANRLQVSLNLALGSALASIGLTIPAVALASVVLGVPIMLGLSTKDVVLMSLVFLVSSSTFVSGRTNWMLGAVHLVIFLAFLFLTLVP